MISMVAINLKGRQFMSIKLSAHKGFTLVEMLVVVPIALILIAVLVNAMIRTTQSASLANDRSIRMAQLNRALDLIEQDVAVSNQFLSRPAMRNHENKVDSDYLDEDQNSVQLSDSIRCGIYPETYVGNKCVNSGTSSKRLIVNRLATITPLDADTNVKVLAHFKKGGFGEQYCKYNPPVLFNVIYFIKNDKLYRRNIMPFVSGKGYDWDLFCQWTERNEAGQLKTYHLPWQKPTCSAKDFTNGSGLSYRKQYCQAQDLLLLDNAEMTIEYLNNDHQIDDSQIYLNPTDHAASQRVLDGANTVRVVLKSRVTLTGSKKADAVRGEIIVRKLSDLPSS